MLAEHFNRNEETLAALELILQQENPCAIQVTDGVVSCREGTPCCKGCELLTSRGCKGVPPACKFYFCHTAWNFLQPETQQRITQLGEAYIGPLRLRGTRQRILSRPPYVW